MHKTQKLKRVSDLQEYSLQLSSNKDNRCIRTLFGGLCLRLKC